MKSMHSRRISFTRQVLSKIFSYLIYSFSQHHRKLSSDPAFVLKYASEEFKDAKNSEIELPPRVRSGFTLHSKNLISKTKLGIRWWLIQEYIASFKEISTFTKMILFQAFTSILFYFLGYPWLHYEEYYIAGSFYS